VSLLEVRGLDAGYGRVQILWDVSLAVEAEQIVALVGANGAGKTTLLRTVSGMIPSRSGSITFAGREIAGAPIENIVNLGIARVVELFPILGSRLNQVASTLSGGEQQMCAIARGLMGAPELLLIDELSLGLAPKTVDEIVARLPDISRSGTAVLLVEQDIDAALTISTQAYVLETGRITRGGPSAQLLEDPTIQEAYLGLAPS
jgi:branched-chain amino acid transport system ATP-binding protein